MMPWAGLFSLGKGLIGLADKAIEDKDQRLAFQTKILERTFDLFEKLIATPTNPTLDALVKFILVFNFALKGLFRPVGSFALVAFAGWMRARGTPLPDYIEVAFFGTPIAWGTSRHIEKNKRPKRPEEEFEDYMI